MFAQNHCHRFRPLLGGISVICRGVEEFGTLGAVVRDTLSNEPWALSCAHVFASAGMVAGDQAILLQPDGDPDENKIDLVRLRISRVFDCAAYKLPGSVDVLSGILGIGELSAPVEPQLGMRVIKSGMATGVTEGIIVDIDGDELLIQNPYEDTHDYEIALPGDSGSVWCESSTRAPVGLHYSGTSGSAAKAYRILTVLSALSLRF